MDASGGGKSCGLSLLTPVNLNATDSMIPIFSLCCALSPSHGTATIQRRPRDDEPTIPAEFQTTHTREDTLRKRGIESPRTSLCSVDYRIGELRAVVRPAVFSMEAFLRCYPAHEYGVRLGEMLLTMLADRCSATGKRFSFRGSLLMFSRMRIAFHGAQQDLGTNQRH